MRYFRHTSISISRIYSGYLDTDTMRYIAWYRYHIICKYTPKQVDFQTKWRVFVRVKIKAWSKSVSIQTDRRKRLAACVLRNMLVGCRSVNQFDSKWRQRRKLISEQFFSRDQNEGKHGSGEGRGVSTMWPRIWVPKGREFGEVMSRKYARMGQKKKNASMNEWISCTFWCVYWSVGCGTSQ